MRTIVIGLLIAAAGIVAISTSYAATDSCQVNCVTTERFGDKLLTVWFDAEGVPQDAITVDLPREAKRLSDKRSVPSQSFSPEALSGQQSIQGGTVETTQETYQTATEIIVVITTTYRDANGNIVDVQVTVLRFDIVDPLD